MARLLVARRYRASFNAKAQGRKEKLAFISTLILGLGAAWPTEVCAAKCKPPMRCPTVKRPACPKGKVKNIDTRGKCCWPGQLWCRLKKRCVGQITCPPGMRRDGSGQGCAAIGPQKALAAGANFTCGLKQDGGVSCWGGNGQGQPTPKPGRYLQLAAGTRHACGLKEDGSVGCWGGNYNGQSTPPAELRLRTR